MGEISDYSVVWIVAISILAVENVVCLLAISARKRWKSPDVLLFSLIMAYFLTLVLPLLLYAVVTLGKSEWLESACKFLVWCVMSFKIVNSLQICFLSMDRVWTLKWPSSYRIHNTAKQSMRTVSFIWIFGLAIGTIPLLGWPEERLANKLCSLILDVGGYGYSLCIVVIILGSFAVSSVCVVTIVLHLSLRNISSLEGGQSQEFKQPIPEIVIESETGERTAAVHVSREVQNRQICILVSVMVTMEFFVSGIPFVVINLMALVSNKQQDWMTVSLVWCNLVVTFINPILLGVICLRYRRGYAKLGQCFGEVCGCTDTSIRDTSMGKCERRAGPTELLKGGIQRQETVDSLDNFSDAEDEYGHHSSNFSDISFSVDMDDEQALEYGITASMEQDIRSLEQAGILSPDSVDFDNEAYIKEEEIRNALSSKERRALWLAQKALRRQADGQQTPGGNRDEAGTSSTIKESPQFLSVDRVDSLNQHRKLERNSRPKDSGRKADRSTNEEAADQTLHTVKVEIENGGLGITRADADREDSLQKDSERPATRKEKSGEGKEKRLRNGGIVSSQSYDAPRSSEKKSKKKRRRSVPLDKEEAVYNVKLSPVKTQGEGHGLRSNRFDMVRERMLSEMSTIHGSGELYDIPEEEDAEDFQETSFAKTLAPDRGHPGTAMSQEQAPDKPFEQVSPPRTPKSTKKHKKKSKDKRYSKKITEKVISIDTKPLTKEEEWLKKAIERTESSSHCLYDSIPSDTDTNDGSISEHSGYITTPNSSIASKMDAFPSSIDASIDASIEYDMDMIVIEHVDMPPSPVKKRRAGGKINTERAIRVVANGTDDRMSREDSDETGDVASGRQISSDLTSSNNSKESSQELSQQDNSTGSDDTQKDTEKPTTVKKGLPSNAERQAWVSERDRERETSRPRANSAGAGQTTSAKDRREKYKRARSERIVLEPIISDSSQEVLYL